LLDLMSRDYRIVLQKQKVEKRMQFVTKIHYVRRYKFLRLFFELRAIKTENQSRVKFKFKALFTKGELLFESNIPLR